MVTKTVKKKAAPKKKDINKTATKQEEPSLQIIQTTKCQTVSNKSTLTYNIGVDDDKAVFMRILSNTGGGYFSNEWISLENITSVLGDVSGEHITSIHLIPLFKGKSVNTPGYLLAVLVNETVLVSVEGKKRKYHFTGAETLLAKIAKKL